MAARNLCVGLLVSGWVGTRFSANPRFAVEGRKYSTCTLAEGPSVYFGRGPVTFLLRREGTSFHFSLGYLYL